ncbi:class I SAM-dependent methyltransferase [Pontimonas sp.]|nr:class I SAM-dependent methyltransferase [Pontimonas sp.]
MSIYEGADVLENLADLHNYNEGLRRAVSRGLVGNRVLDFGAGSGTFAHLLETETRKVLCLEPDTSLRGRLEASGFEARESLEDFPETFFDSIYTLNVLEHIEDDMDVLRALRDKIVERGHLVVFVPAHPWLFSSFDLRVGHVRRYRKAELEAKIEAAGFEIITSRYFDSLGLLAAALYKLMDRGNGTLSPRALHFFDKRIFPFSLALDNFTKPFFGKNILVSARSCSDAAKP